MMIYQYLLWILLQLFFSGIFSSAFRLMVSSVNLLSCKIYSNIQPNALTRQRTMEIILSVNSLHHIRFHNHCHKQKALKKNRHYNAGSNSRQTPAMAAFDSVYPRKPAALRISGRKRNHGAVCTVKTWICKCIVQVIGHCDPDHLHCIIALSWCHKHKNNGYDQHWCCNDQVRSCFSLCTSGVVDPLSDHQISEHENHR